MQHDKSSKKTAQIEKVTSSGEDITLSIVDAIKLFKLPPKFNYLKRSGFLASTVLTVLLLLPFVGASSVAAFFVKALNNGFAGEKDVLYRFKNNPQINWRKLLIFFAQRFSYLVNLADKDLEDVQDAIGKLKVIIFDDSLMEKTGNSIEGVGLVHDHGSNLHILGFKILVCGFWDGHNFIPIDFSIHRENRSGKTENLKTRIIKKRTNIDMLKLDIDMLNDKVKQVKKDIKTLKYALKQKESKSIIKKTEKKQKTLLRINSRILKKRMAVQAIENKIVIIENEILEIKSNFCGLETKEYKNQFRKTRKRNSPGYIRKNEIDHSKIDSAIKMLKRAVNNGFIPKYVLTDTWFFCSKLIEALKKIDIHVDLIAMAKIGIAKYKDITNGKFYTPKELIIIHERKKAKYSRKYNAKYIQIQGEYQGARVKLFLIQFGKGRWRMLVSTNIKLQLSNIIEIYKIRWTIEVFFKDCKQYVLLGKSQARDFDSQIADATLSMIRYIMLSYYQRTHHEMTIGGIFNLLSSQQAKVNMLTEINQLLGELFEIFAEITGADYFSVYEDLLRSEKAHPLLFKLGWLDKTLDQ